MKITNTKDAQHKPSIIMLVYGEGGAGKTTFVSTAPNPVLADCENGSKYFGLRDISLDVGHIKKWSDLKDFFDAVLESDYETIAVDPIGDLMDKLMKYMVAEGDSKKVQKDGSPTMAGWGWLKKTMRDIIKVLRDSGKNIIFVAHLDEKADEERMIKRPMIQTKLSQEIVNLVDIVGYMTKVVHEGEEKRVIIVDPSNEKYTAKDRTGQLGRYIEPNFTKIVEACRGNKKFSWSKENAKVKTEEKPKKKVTKKTTKKVLKKEEPKEELQDASEVMVEKEPQSEAGRIMAEAKAKAQDKLNKAK